MKVDPEIKIKVVEEYLQAVKSVAMISKELSVGTSTVGEWIRRYNEWGPTGLYPLAKPEYYSKELKLNAIRDFKKNELSLESVALKYGIRSKTQLRKWIIDYNNHKEIKSSGHKGDHFMVNKRKTSLEERIEIVKFCLEHGKNYNKSALKYNVSYQQVRSWVKKYETSGADGLIDSRGKRKPSSELSDIEKIKIEMKLLEARNRRLEMENAVLKKLKELEGRS